MKLIKCLLTLSIMCGALVAAALPAKAKLTPCKKSTGDEIILTHGHPYLGGSRSPGDSIGMTGLEYQANGGCEKRIYVDDSLRVHVTWMKIPFPFVSIAQRRMEYNFRYPNGSWYGETDDTPFGCGYGSLDLTRMPPQRYVISFHYNTGSNAFYPHISIAHWWHSAPYNNWLWPIVTCANNGYIIMATDDNSYPHVNYHHLLVTTDEGVTWINPFNTDSAATFSHYVISSDYPGSNKVVFVETRYITDSAAAGQLDNNVWYRLSTDGGLTWGAHTNVTNYQVSDSVRAFCNVSALFDNYDKLHIVWAGRRVVNGQYYDASKIFHWDEVHDTITVVSHSTGLFEGGWWGWTNPNGYGAWRLPADQPQMTVDYSTGALYCFWCGQNDTADVSAGGYPNGDIYAASSYDRGLTWSQWVNLTNTHTPGALPDFCEDEDYITVNPLVVNDSIYLSYIEDKDAGAIVQSEGDTTNNIVRVWIFHKDVMNIEDSKVENKRVSLLEITPNPSQIDILVTYNIQRSAEISMKVFDISGQLVKIIDRGRKEAGNHQVKVNINEMPAGTYFIVLKDGVSTRTAKLIKAR